MKPGMRRSYVDTRLGQLHVARSGEGPPIVLLPGASQSHNALRRLTAQLETAMEVVAIDMPGSGHSGPLPAGADFAQLADAVVDAIGALGLARPCLYGIHTGNKIGASICARYPQKVSALVFCGQSHSLIADKEVRTQRMRQVAAKRFQSNADPATAQLRGRLALWRELEGMWWREDPVAGQLPEEQLAERRLLIADLLLSVESLPQLYEANFAYDLEADLRRIALPTLVVEIATPHEDRTVGRQGETVQRLIPGARLVTFEEPDGLGLTLENRAAELADAIVGFVRALP